MIDIHAFVANDNLNAVEDAIKQGVGIDSYDEEGRTPIMVAVENAKTSAAMVDLLLKLGACLLYTSPSPRDLTTSRMPSSA